MPPQTAPASPSEPGPTAERPQLPANPVAYDSVRNEHARNRGLPQAYIAGGDDPELGETLHRERQYVRLLIAMVAVVVALGFVLGIIGALISGPA